MCIELNTCESRSLLRVPQPNRHNNTNKACWGHGHIHTHAYAHTRTEHTVALPIFPPRSTASACLSAPCSCSHHRERTCHTHNIQHMSWACSCSRASRRTHVLIRHTHTMSTSITSLPSPPHRLPTPRPSSCTSCCSCLLSPCREAFYLITWIVWLFSSVCDVCVCVCVCVRVCVYAMHGWK